MKCCQRMDWGDFKFLNTNLSSGNQEQIKDQCVSAWVEFSRTPDGSEEA